MKKNLKKFIIVSTLILFFVFYFGFNNFVSGAEEESFFQGDLSGYAWGASSTNGGMGWLSFGGTTPSYGVSVNSTGDLVGYAWSSNFGWLRFGELSGFPTGTGTQARNAYITDNSLKGWARFCSVLTTSDCTGTTMKTSAKTGGWDGWVSLSGTDYGVGLDQNTGVFSACPDCYAWGSDVVGWIDFSRLITIPSETKLFLKANNETGYTVIRLGNQASISATGSMLNTVGGEASGAWSGNKTCPDSLTPPTSYETFTHNTLGTFTYTLKCSKSDGSGKITSSVDVVVISQDPDECLVTPKPSFCLPTKKKPIYIEN